MDTPDADKGSGASVVQFYGWCAEQRRNDELNDAVAREGGQTTDKNAESASCTAESKGFTSNKTGLAKPLFSSVRSRPTPEQPRLHVAKPFSKPTLFALVVMHPGIRPMFFVGLQ